MVGQTKATVTDAVRRLHAATPNEVRVVQSMMSGGGSMKHSGASWVHFGSKSLAEAQVVTYFDGEIVIGPFFEDYLIEKNLTSEHNAYLQLIRDGKYIPVEVKEEIRDVESVLENIQELIAMTPAVVGRVDIIAKGRAELLEMVQALAEVQQGMIQREFGEVDARPEEEFVSDVAES